MIEMREDNPVDNFFRDSIESAEAKPSEQFWNKAYESIIVREGNANRKRMMLWRSAAVLLAFAMAGMLSYQVYISGKVNGLHNEITKIEKYQARAEYPKASNADHLVAATANHDIATKATRNEPLNPIATHSVAAAKHTVAISRHSSHRNAQRGRIVQVALANSTQAATMNPHQNVLSGGSSNPASNNLSTALAVNNSSSAAASGSKLAPARPLSLAAINKIRNAINFKALFNPVTEGLLPFLNATYPESTKSSESMLPDSALMNEPDPAQKVKSYFADVMIPKFSISGFFSVNNLLIAMKGYNPIENINASKMNANEGKENAFSSGLNIGYDISPRFTIQAGCNYQQYQFSIAPTPINLNGNDLNGYLFETSSGTITLPLLAGPNSAAVTAQGSAIRSYIDIPLQLKWNFVEDKKLKLYITAGGALNVLAVNWATIGWENSYGSMTAKTTDIAGTNAVTCCYLAGLGAEYKLVKGFSAYIEGTYLGALMPVSGGGENYISTKTNLLSETVGIKYHL